MDHYTIVIHTRMRRKIFLAGNVSDRAVQLIVENAPSGTYICGYRMFPNAAAIKYIHDRKHIPGKIVLRIQKSYIVKAEKRIPGTQKDAVNMDSEVQYYL